MKKIIFTVVGIWCLAAAPTAFAMEREFFPGEGFRAGCERGGLNGGFEFLRNGRVGTFKFPGTGAAWVIFQVSEADKFRWSVTNNEDELRVDFERGTLAYAFDDGSASFRCEGTFTP
jgi:hypothetical protein